MRLNQIRQTNGNKIEAIKKIMIVAELAEVVFNRFFHRNRIVTSENF